MIGESKLGAADEFCDDWELQSFFELLDGNKIIQLVKLGVSELDIVKLQRLKAVHHGQVHLRPNYHFKKLYISEKS